jgi:hypothetical protein
MAESLNPQAGRIAAQFALAVPPATVDSMVGIVAAKQPVVRQFGTGTLFRVADRAFVITAGHVIRQAHDMQATLGIAAAPPTLMALTEQAIATTPDDGGCDYDLAAIPLTDNQQSTLTSIKRFLTFADVQEEDTAQDPYYVITGFPAIWATPSEMPSQRLSLKPLQIGGERFKGHTGNLHGYDPRRHLLVVAEEENAYNEHGKGLDFRHRGGAPATFPGDIYGVSGSAVWRIGDLDVDQALWKASDARLVGVQTGSYPAARAIKVTRWIGVTTLLHLAYPDLRSAIELHGYQ